MNDQLTAQPNPFAMTTFAEVEKMATYMADARVYGFKKPSQVISAMLLAHESGKKLSTLMEEKHFFEDGKISPKASNMQATFQKTGTILWHLRTPTVVAGSFFANKKPIEDADRERACQRFELQYELDIMQMSDQTDDEKLEAAFRKRESELMLSLSKLARENECTIIRTMAQAEALGLSEKSNYLLGAANMHQWRCVSDAIKLIDPAALAGSSTDVDIQDLGMLEQRVAIDQKSPQEREKDAIKAIMAQHLEDAETAAGERRKDLLGMASEMRCKLADMEPRQVHWETPVAPDKGAPKESYVDSDPTLKVVKVAMNEPDDDQLPGLDSPAIHEPKITDWRDHVVSTIRACNGKKLGELSKQEIEVLHASFMKKDLPAASREVQKEASQVAIAFESLHQKKGKK